MANIKTIILFDFTKETEEDLESEFKKLNEIKTNDGKTKANVGVVHEAKCFPGR